VEDKDRTKEQLIKELSRIRKKRDKLESVKSVHKSRKDPLNKKMTLKESENKYRKLFNNLKSGVAIYEAIDNGNDFIFKDINRTVEKVEKVKKKEIIGRSIKKVFPGVVEFGLFDIFKRVYNTGKSQKHPVTLYKDDRLIGWRENYVYKLPTGEVVAVYDDVSEYKQQEEKLKHLNSVLNTVRNVNQLITKEKNKTRLIKRACKIFLKDCGYHGAWIALVDEKRKLTEAVEAGVGKDFQALVGRIKKGRLTACWKKVMSSSAIIINKNPKKDCKDCPLSESHNGMGTMTVKLKHDKKVYGVLSVSTSVGYIENKKEQDLFTEVAGDISFALYSLEREEKQKEAVRKLKESEHRFERLSKSAREGIIFHDGGIILDANKAAADMAGVKVTDLIGKSPYSFMHPETINKARKMAMEGFERAYEGKLVKPNGKIADIEIIGSLTYYDGRKVRVVVFRDITRQKVAEAKLQNSYAKLKKTLTNIIDALGKVVEFRDPYTAGHQRRVASLAIAISKDLDLDKDRIEALGTAAIIHDIGKIDIPATILAKPGKLSGIEFEMLKTHPQIGYDIIKKIDFPWPIAGIILQHHERLDGSGYPNGLKDKDISLEAKILAIADVMEAMSSHRPYRPALGIKKTLKEIKANSGKFYDAKAADACIKLFNKKKFKFD